MTTQEIKKAMKEFSDAGTVFWGFSGGEPLLRNDIGELIDYAKKMGFFTTLTTNGMLINENIDNLKKIDYLSISLDGPKEINDHVRGYGTFDAAMKAIKLIKNEGKKLSISCTISKINVKDNFYGLRKLFKLVKKLDCPVLFSPVWKDIYNESQIKNLLLSDKEYFGAWNLIEDFKKNNPESVIISDDALEWFKQKNNDKLKWRCFAGRLFCKVYNDGLVCSCGFKEKFGINGLEQGFVNAFKKLKNYWGDCKCWAPCYVEYNLALILSLKSLINLKKHFAYPFIRRYKKD
jgi:MoaA/NifB/PqqE/SkfB family radical SAM enzyme